jgi:hypothetical protein
VILKIIDRYLFLSLTSINMPRTTQKARKSTGAAAKTRKTLKQCAPTIESKDLITSKRPRTSDAADKVDSKRARILVEFQLLVFHLQTTHLLHTGF